MASRRGVARESSSDSDQTSAHLHGVGARGFGARGVAGARGEEVGEERDRPGRARVPGVGFAYRLRTFTYIDGHIKPKYTRSRPISEVKRLRVELVV